MVNHFKTQYDPHLFVSPINEVLSTRMEYRHLATLMDDDPCVTDQDRFDDWYNHYYVLYNNKEAAPLAYKIYWLYLTKNGFTDISAAVYLNSCLSKEFENLAVKHSLDAIEFTINHFNLLNNENLHENSQKPQSSSES